MCGWRTQRRDPRSGALPWGLSVAANGRTAVEIPQSAAGAGNELAAWTLVNLLRDSNENSVRRKPKAASDATLAYAGQFSETERWQLERLRRAAAALDEAAYTVLAEEVLSNSGWVTKEFGPLLMKANENAAIFVLQAKLAPAGANIGETDGFSGLRTLAAMHDACLVAMRPPLVMTA